MTEQAPTQAKSSCRWTRILLFISLAGNLAVIGLVAGAIFHAQGPGGGDRFMARDPGAALFLKALEPDDRKAMIKRLRAEGRGPAATRKEARAQFTALLEALRAEPFEAATLKEVLDAQAESAEARRTVGQVAFVERVVAMSAEERAAFAQRLEDTLKRHRPKPDRKGD
ncbi:MAG: periplasmic heavy metal sensor [Brevirhabdus sp.]